MELFESNYWKLTITLQKLVGFWYFQSIWKNYIAWFYVYFFTFSFVIAMGIRLYNEIGVNLDIVVENILGEMYLSLILCKLTLNIIFMNEITTLISPYVVNIYAIVVIIILMYPTEKPQMKTIYTQIANDWKTIHDAEELKIMHKYTEIGRKIVLLYSGYMIVGVVLFLSLPITAPLLDYIIPLENGTRPKALPYYAEYGIDLETYYYPLITQAIFGGSGTILVFVTFDLGFILVVQHVIALFALVNYRIHKVSRTASAIENHIVDFINGDRTAYRQTISAITLHQIVVKYVDDIEHCYSITWLFVLFINMLLVGGGFAVVIMKLDRPEETLRYSIIVGAILTHFYYIFLPGQKIIDSSSEVFDACYDCKWYLLSEKSKTLIKLIMVRSIRRCEITGGKMFVLCMDTYCNMMKTGFSVFTLVR